MMKEFEQREAVPPSIKATLRGIHALGYDIPAIEQGNLEMYSWHCAACGATRWALVQGGAIENCTECAEDGLEIGDPKQVEVVQVLLQGNPLRRAVAAMCPIRLDVEVGAGMDDLRPVTSEHLAIASAMAEAFTLACSPEAIREPDPN